MAQYLTKEGADILASGISQKMNALHALTLKTEDLGKTVVPLGTDKKIPQTYLPSYVDDVLEYANYSSLPQSGESGKIYVTLNDGKTYRWGGTAYVEISASLAIGEDSSTAFAGDRGVRLESYFNNGIAKEASKMTNALSFGSKTYDGSVAGVTIVKADLGLGNVQNTAFYTRKVYVNGVVSNFAGTTANTQDLSFYAPTTHGNATGHFLTSKMGEAPVWSDPLSLRVGSADKLTTTRKIWGQSFNGTDDVDGDLIANGNIKAIGGGVSAQGIADFGLTGGSGSGGSGTAYTLNIVPSTNKVSIQLQGADGSSSTKDLAIFSTTQAGVVPSAPSSSSVLKGNGWGTLSASDIPNLDWSKITSGKPTTLGGYGITDAKIANGVITLGSNTITPIVSSDLKTLTFAAGSFSAGSYTPTSAKTINIPTTTAHITESGNLYFTNARAQAAITGGASTIVTSNLTSSRVLVSNTSGKVAVSDVTSTELGYLDGVSSNIQTQLNSKFPSANFTKANIKSTLGISDWALATSKPSYSASDISNLSLTLDAAYDWDASDNIDADNYGFSLTVGSSTLAMSAMTKAEVNAIITKYFA